MESEERTGDKSPTLLDPADERRPDTVMGHNLAFSPDGRTLVYVGGGENERKLFLRPLEHLDAVEVAGLRGVHHPVFSPDGALISYAAKGFLHLIPVGSSDRPQTTRPMLSEKNSRGGMDWLPDGSLVICLPEEGLLLAFLGRKLFVGEL
jgi:hypothetical protein